MSLLDVLPPSPPTTASREVTITGPRPSLTPPIVMSTPEDSPASMPGSSNPGSRKKVEFCAQPNIYNAAVFASSPEQAASIKSLPPSREHRPGRRSILKPPSQIEVPLQNTDSRQEVKLSVNENMDSIVQQLSKNDKPTSIDAYNTLASLFRAYEELPEAIVLKNKLSTLIRYMRRDLACQDKGDEQPRDTNLVLSALKLLIILVWNTAYSRLLSEDAKTFILERSIHVISEHRASKNVIAHYLHLLSTQNFRPLIMTTNNRASRLLDALKELPDHVSSSAVISETVMVLGHLTDQARPVMRAKADCWVEILLKTMVTASRDTRQKAISFGMKACSAFANAPSVSMAFRDMLKSKTDADTTLEATACKRLKAMFIETDDAVLVPQVWATVLLLAVNTAENVQEWTSLRSCWLEVIQKCFNSSDTAVRLQANFAWNRLVCLARPHQATDALAALLSKPVAGQMERSGRDRQGQDSRMSARSSYCNLLYYAFRPAATHKEYTKSWNEYMVKILRSSFFVRNPSNADFACRIFMALTWNSTRVTKVWKETRAHDNARVEPEELPTIDAKWLRKNCGTILQMYKLLFTHSTWGSSNASDQSFVASAWKHFAKSLGEAASKEIKASSETIQACAHVVRFVQELWQDGSRAVNASNEGTEALKGRLTFLLRVFITELGAAPFVDVLRDEGVQLPVMLLWPFAATAVDMKHALHGAEDQFGGAYLPPKPGAPTLLLLERTLCVLDKRLSDAHEAPTLDLGEVDSALELLSICLQDSPENIITLTLHTMNSSLQSWLRDGNRSSTIIQATEIARTNRAQQFAAITVPCLGRLPHLEVKALDGLFAAGFSSTHKDTINQMVEMWNMTHGQASQMAYGPMLTIALKRLRSYVDIDLVDFNLDDLHDSEFGQSNTPPAFLDFAESQSQPAMADPLEKDVEMLKRNSSPMQCHDDQSPHEVDYPTLPAQEDIGATATSRPPSSHSTPQRRRRHDDSQVQFQPIDSSPFTRMQEESQYLADRQNQVRNRQRHQPSVYFSDLRPDVVPKPTSTMIPTGELGRRALIDERPSTPTLPGGGLTDFDNNPTASPTPRSKHQTLRLEDIEIPSSPPSEQADEETIGADVLKEGNAVEGSESFMEEDVEMVDGYVTMTTKPQDTPNHHSQDEDGRNPHPTKVSLLRDEVEHTAHSVLQDRQEVCLEREIITEADSAVREEAHTKILGEHQPEKSSSDNNKVQSSPVRLGSDELDMMSQSQLSQDLEWHMSEHGDTPEPISTTEEQEPDPTITKTSTVKTTQKKRKRGSSLYAGSKRRKSRSLSCSVSENSQDRREALSYDCVEVKTSSRLPPTEFGVLQEESQDSDPSERSVSEVILSLKTPIASVSAGLEEPGTIAQEMPRPPFPALRSSAAHQNSAEAQEQEYQAVMDTSKHGRPAARDQSPLIGEAENAAERSKTLLPKQFQETDVPWNLPLTKEMGDQTIRKTFNDVASGPDEYMAYTGNMAVQTISTPQQDVAVQIEADIMTSLQDVLERLKQSNGESLDLRAIDDMCFHIRTEGQNAFNRWTSP